MNKKNVTIEDLSRLITKNSVSLEKHVDKKIENLAIMVGKGFNEMGNRIGNVENRIGNVETRLGTVEKRLDTLDENIKATRRDVLDIGDRFVPRYEFDNLLIRFNRLEAKIKSNNK